MATLKMGLAVPTRPLPTHKNALKTAKNKNS